MALSSKTLAIFYQQLATMLEAGVSIQRCMETFQRTSRGSLQKAVSPLHDAVMRGQAFHEGFSGKFFPRLDGWVLSLAEKSGGMDKALRSLSKHHENRALAIRKIQVALILPVMILITGIAVIQLPPLILTLMGQGDFGVMDYSLAVVRSLLSWVIIPWFLWTLIQIGLKVDRVNVVLDRVLMAVPVIGKIRKCWVFTQWNNAIRLMLNAGIGVLDAVKEVSQPFMSPALASAMQKVEVHMNGTVPMSRVMEASGFFPPMMIQHWCTGEQSGRMDESLEKLVNFLNEETKQALKITTILLPIMIYGGICIYMAAQILKMAQGYVNTINSFMN